MLYINSHYLGKAVLLFQEYAELIAAKLTWRPSFGFIVWRGFQLLTDNSRKPAISPIRLFYFFLLLSCKTTAVNYTETLQSTVIIHRLDFTNTWPYKKLTIFIDGEKQESKIPKGQTLIIPISYGTHSIYARLGSAQSETINFISGTFVEPLVFFAIIDGRPLHKKNIFLSQREITDETWWPKIATHNKIDWKY